MHHVILLLLYADDVAIFVHDVDGIEHLIGALKAFCQSSEPIVNVDKISVNHPASLIPYVYI